MRKTLLVDFDGTLMDMSWPRSLEGVEPKPGVIEALRNLTSKGWRIIIFTARMWPGWQETEGSEFFERQLQEMLDWLKRWEVPHDKVTCTKEPAMWMIDDRSLNPDYMPTPELFWESLPEWLELNAEVDRYGHSREDAEREAEDAGKGES